MKIQKKIILAAICGCFCLASSLAAALPPLYQTVQEIEALLKNKQLGTLLPDGEPIMSINKTEDGYEVMTTRHKLVVKVIYKPQSHPGPAKFDIDYREVVPLD